MTVDEDKGHFDHSLYKVTSLCSSIYAVKLKQLLWIPWPRADKQGLEGQ